MADEDPELVLLNQLKDAFGSDLDGIKNVTDLTNALLIANSSTTPQIQPGISGIPNLTPTAKALLLSEIQAPFKLQAKIIDAYINSKLPSGGTGSD